MILNEAVALAAALRELLRRLGRMETPGCQLGGTSNLSRVHLGKQAQQVCKGQRFQILRPASSARWLRSSFTVELRSSGLSASATDAHNAPVHDEERRRAVDGGHPTGAGASARREKSLPIALLVPAHATSQANRRLPRQPCCSHRSCVKHHKRNTVLDS